MSQKKLLFPVMWVGSWKKVTWPLLGVPEVRTVPVAAQPLLEVQTVSEPQ